MDEVAGAVLVAGHMCVDLTPRLSKTPGFRPGQLVDVGPADLRLGGCVANTARSLVTLAVPTRVSALLGDDELADLGSTLAAGEGFASSALTRAPGASTSYSIVLETPGTDRMFWHHAGANDLFDGSTVDLDGVAILHVGYPSLLAALRAHAGAALVDLFQRARERSIVTSLDLAVVSDGAHDDWDSFFDAVLPLTDVISPSIDDLRSASSAVDPTWERITAADAANDLVRRGVAVALVTAGAGGMHLATGDAARMAATGGALRVHDGWTDLRVSLAARATPGRVTTNGAGDAASAGLLAGIHRRLDPVAAAELAAVAASAAITTTRPAAPILQGEHE